MHDLRLRAWPGPATPTLPAAPAGQKAKIDQAAPRRDVRVRTFLPICAGLARERERGVAWERSYALRGGMDGWMRARVEVEIDKARAHRTS